MYGVNALAFLHYLYNATVRVRAYRQNCDKYSAKSFRFDKVFLNFLSFYIYVYVNKF